MTTETEELKRTDAADTAVLYCFVCTGNTCRSPMAAAVFNSRFGKDGKHAVSRGLCASGVPISRNSLEALRQAGIESTPDNDYENHISRQLDGDIMKQAMAVIAMTSTHYMNIIMAYPEYASKVFVMPEDISDPFGGDLERYKACLGEINDGITAAFGDGHGN